MLRIAVGSVQLAGVLRLQVEEVIGVIATHTTVIVMKPSLNAASPVAKNALLTASSKVSIIRTNKR
jgi:hypothetical protein